MNKEPQQNNNIKATSQGLRVLPIVVLAAVLLYFAMQVYNYFSDPLTTTLVYESQAEDVVSLDGWLVRDEEALPEQSGTVSHALQEGQKVGAGQTVATVYADASALQTVSRIETLELQLQQLEFALTSYLDPDAALKLDTSITGDILTLRQTLSAGDYAAADSDLAALKAAVLKRDHAYTSQEEIQSQVKSVESELAQLKSSLSGAVHVTAKSAGTYSAVCDGYETVLTPALLEGLTPSRLSAVRPTADHGSMGKLIYGDTWYYAVSLPYDQARTIKTMGSVNLRLAKGFEQTIRMRVEHVSAEENGQAAVVLSCRKYLAQTTLLRHQAADVVLHTSRRSWGIQSVANCISFMKKERSILPTPSACFLNASYRSLCILCHATTVSLSTFGSVGGIIVSVAINSLFVAFYGYDFNRNCQFAYKYTI